MDLPVACLKICGKKKYAISIKSYIVYKAHFTKTLAVKHFCCC